MTSTTRQIHIDYVDGTPLATDDPRCPMARAAQAAGAVMAQFPADDSRADTPCAEWDALAVAQHMIAVVDRVAAAPSGRAIVEMPILADVGHAGLVDSLEASLHTLQHAWLDDATLATMIEVPWGLVPGAAVMAMYSSELLVHTWDLAVAIGVGLNWPEADIAGDLSMAKVSIPDGPRHQMPFGPAVAPTGDAPAIEHLAGWVGRDVIGWRAK